MSELDLGGQWGSMGVVIANIGIKDQRISFWDPIVTMIRSVR